MSLSNFTAQNAIYVVGVVFIVISIIMALLGIPKNKLVGLIIFYCGIFGFILARIAIQLQ